MVSDSFDERREFIEMEIEIKKYIYHPIESIMYVVVENKNALVVDPNMSEEAEQYMDLRKVSNMLIILTHEHCDHITGVNRLKEKYNAKVLCSQKCADGIRDSHSNLSDFYNILIEDKGWCGKMEPFICNADDTFEEQLEYDWESHHLILHETPGHSKGSICILMDDKYFFTGDSLIPEREVVTILPGGSKEQYREVTKPYLDCVINNRVQILPGHEVLTM